MTTIALDINLEACHFHDQNPPAPPRTFLQDHFARTGLKRSEVARQIGYKNLNKGCRRIIEWIDAEKVDSDIYGDRFLEVLGVTREALHQENLRHHRLWASTVIYRENNFEYRMLTRHVNLLLEHQEQICSIEQWGQIHLPDIGLFTMYVNTPSIRLGQLLNSWIDTPMRQGDFFILKVIGSPLSGSHHVYGFDRNNPIQLEKRGRIFNRLLDGIQLFPQKHKRLSTWSLGQLLVKLGVELPPTKIYVERDEIGEYDYASQTLTLHGTTYSFHYTLSKILDRTRKVIHPTLNNVVLYKQNLQLKGRILCHWDQDLPPTVAEQVAKVLLDVNSTD